MDKKLFILAWLPAILMMAVIFQFSSSTGEQSSGLSSGVTESLINTVVQLTDTDLNPLAEEQLQERIHTPIRKVGHFSEYTVFSMAVILPLYIIHKKRGKLLFLYTLTICFLYACTDEIHQLFVPERSGQFSDVLIDTAGVCFGFILFLILYRVNAKRKCN